MKDKRFDRREIMRFAGTALGMGALYSVLPGTLLGEGHEFLDHMGKHAGEKVTPFTFLQLSDAHVGFNGPPAPLGTQAFEHAVELVNKLPKAPDLVLFTGDLTHDSEDKDLHSKRMELFKQITSRMNAGKVYYVPGENDAGLDGGQLYREHFGETYYSFDHRGVHFIALDNVSQGKPRIGAEQLAWLKKDLSRFHKSAPIVVFTHRPLFDLKPEWEWFTNDGDDVMNAVSSYRNLTVLYGHIHRRQVTQLAGTTHYGANSLIFAFPDPDSGVEKKPLPFDKSRPFANLGARRIHEGARPVGVEEIELTTREFAGVAGIQQFSKKELV
jgi:3',5'-cyclic AMP phosphodiesterase CpdA